MSTIVKEIERIKEEYIPGTRIKMIQMEDKYHPVPPGTLGTVTDVDDVGTIHTRWDNGSGLGVCLEVDKIEIVEPPYVSKLFRTGELISDKPLNENSVGIPAGTVFDDEFDIIENDEGKDYGYGEINFVEGQYRAEYYKHRLPVKHFDTYAEAVDEIRECSNYSEGDKETLKDAIDEYLDWWMSPISVKDMKISNIPVFSLTDEEIKNLLDRGFNGNRIFIRRKMNENF